MYELFPLSVASTTRNKQGIKKIFFSQQDGDDFIVQWLNQLFKEAEKVNADNYYITEACTIDETIPYSMEVSIVGFNSSRFDISLIIQQMQCKDWTISNYIGSPSQAKQAIVHHKKLNLKVKFVDMLMYLQPMELKQAAKDFGDGYEYKKGLFPYEAFNTDNVNEVLSKSEPLTMEGFNSSLKKTKISQKDYQIYLEDAKRFKNRWDYLQFYNEQDTYKMIKPLMTLISLQFKYKIDMFSFMSMAACTNAIKYAKAYEDFDINGVYPNFEDLSQKFYLTENYWKSKVRGYQVQDKHQRRYTKNNVQDKDFDYFKQLFKDSNCSICGCKFTVNNKPTLDRIDNSKRNSKDNVQLCCLYCNCFCSNKDKNIGKLFIQLRKYCIIRCLPTNLTNNDVYHLIRSGITGGLSNVMHRVNRAGIDFIKRLYYNKEAKKVTVLTTDHRITHVVGVDFNSLYPSVMSSEPHKFIKYTGGKIQMCGSQTCKIIGDTEHSKQTILRIINIKKRFTADGQLFIAEVKGHIDENYLNDYINFPPILRNYEFTTDERTIGSYMYNHMKDNKIKTDQKQRKLTNLLSTKGEYMAFSSYYLWFLIDDCHFIIDDVKQIVPFNKHDQFNLFIKEFTQNRIEAKLDENKGQEQFFKIVMNSSYGSDGMNTEKYHKVKIMNMKQTERAIRSNAFMDEQKISEDNYIVQMNPEHCSCKTPLQVAFFILDNVKYWYLNFIYKFMHKCLDMNKIHFIEGDTDSAYWAISGNSNEDFTQQFNAVISDRDFYNDNAKYFLPTIKGNVYDEKKILGLSFERQGVAMYARAPKNYMIETNYCANSKIKLKGVNQKTNKITKEQTVDCINEGLITKCTNMRLGQKNHQMSQLSIQKNGITGIHTKAIVQENESCCPYLFGLTAKDYSYE
ncbi:MAG: hypothetical protein EZS28_004229 [Streblomastix strix]|uniref:Uncharacterized protein n=1 Tax=Streblomastix strix TaxID=222440 RepID=A0A5J4WZE1_9EUKA|nr:MAG: hypothetical protein EZS28_004229 [Streblomastix strix]